MLALMQLSHVPKSSVGVQSMLTGDELITHGAVMQLISCERIRGVLSRPLRGVKSVAFSAIADVSATVRLATVSYLEDSPPTRSIRPPEKFTMSMLSDGGGYLGD